MTQISSYYASVGVRVDNSALKDIQSYLNKIKSQLKSFQESVSKSSSLKIKMDLDRTGFSNKVRDVLKAVGNTSVLKVKNSSVNTMGLKSSLKAFSDKSSIRISDFKVNRSALNKAINPQSQQQQQNLKGTVLSATISNFRVNKAALNKAVRDVEIGAILLKHFRVDRKAISEAVNRALGANAGQTGSTSIRLGARLSRDSITAMREQIRQGLSDIVIRPNVNARLSTTQRSSGGSVGGGGANKSGGGWSPFQHSFGPRGINPFIFGGMAGGMIRYGAFALPGIAGVLGLNALTNTAMEMQSQRMALSMTAGDGVGKDGTIRSGDYYYDYLDKLGERVGKKTTDIMPDFTQMLAATRGTALEDQLESSFAGLVQYGSVMGLSDDQMKRSTRAFSQMVSKQQVMAEELKGQAAEALPPVIRLAAEVAAGGDTKKLFAMMEKGQLDPNTLIPAITKRMMEDSDKEMGNFWNSLRYNQGMALRAQQEFTRKFLEQGGEKGLTRFFETWSFIVKESINSTKVLGDAFNKASWGLSLMLLSAKEFGQWITGAEKKGNFMTVLFGPSGSSSLLQSIKDLGDEIENTLGKFSPKFTTEQLRIELEALVKILGVVAETATWVSNTLGGTLRLINATVTGGYSAAMRESERNDVLWRVAPNMVDREIEDEVANQKLYGDPNYEVTPEERRRRIMSIVADWETRNPVKPAKQGERPIDLVGNNNWILEGLGLKTMNGSFVELPRVAPPPIPPSPFAPVNYLQQPRLDVAPPQNPALDLNITVKSDGLTPEAESGLIEGIKNWWNETITPMISTTPQTQQ